MTNIDFDSFSHGQVKSKLWLCDHLEPLITKKSRVLILGSWVNVLGFMLLTRQSSKYEFIKGVDLDSKSVDAANKICDYWNIEGTQLSVVDDANTTDMQEFDIIINCSSEHMKKNDWFNNIKPGSLVCIQSSNVLDASSPWLVTNPNSSIECFSKKYPLTTTIFSDRLPISYAHWGYERFMIIGIK
jgi:hypothetical protein